MFTQSSHSIEIYLSITTM